MLSVIITLHYTKTNYVHISWAIIMVVHCMMENSFFKQFDNEIILCNLWRQWIFYFLLLHYLSAYVYFLFHINRIFLFVINTRWSKTNIQLFEIKSELVRILELEIRNKYVTNFPEAKTFAIFKENLSK